MSDNSYNFRSILKSLKKLYPQEIKGNSMRRLTTLAALISGIIVSKSVRLPLVASKFADDRKVESRIKSFSRLLQNAHFDYTSYFMPYATVLLNCLQLKTLAIAIDASTVGRDCIVLVASAIYKNRALPLCWLTQKGNKGHLQENVHIKLIQQLEKLLPENISVVLLGDGEFDGSNLLKTIDKSNWNFVCRTSKNRLLIEDNETFRFNNIDSGKEQFFCIPNVSFNTTDDLTFHAIFWWQKNYKEPIYLLTNIEPSQEAMFWYKKRFKIETMFSDKKSRGFNLDKSHISDPERMAKLLIASSLAYIFIICLGIYALKNGYCKIIHRADRCDLSLFQLGLRMMDFLLNKRKSINVCVQLKLFSN
jgi:hypothetical protein